MAVGLSRAVIFTCHLSGDLLASALLLLLDLQEQASR